MKKRTILIALGLLTSLPPVGAAVQAPPAKAAARAAKPAERFEVSSIKAVRPTLAKTIAALEKQDAAGARAAFEAPSWSRMRKRCSSSTTR